MYAADTLPQVIQLLQTFLSVNLRPIHIYPYTDTAVAILSSISGQWRRNEFKSGGTPFVRVPPKWGTVHARNG